MSKGILSKIRGLFLWGKWPLIGIGVFQHSSSDEYDERYHKQYWDTIARFWDVTPIPVRLSKDTIEIYRCFLKKNEEKWVGKRILILGSTPELRDLLAEETIAKIYVADFSEQMPLAMQRFTKYVDSEKEEWIKANWLHLPFPEQYFDVILGDLVLQQFPPEKEPLFLEKMCGLLKADGVFISRFQFLDKTYYHEENLGEIINKTLDGTLGGRKTIILLKLRILWLYADLKERKLNRKIAIEKLTDYIRGNNFGHPHLREVLRLMLSEKDSLRNWSPPEEQELMSILSRHFSISEIKVASDYEDAKYFPVIFLHKAVYSSVVE
ncbi:MAG: class I SAM-dependent methyltransferase [Candidatus Moranbacteria bacterium]|nr:class I SAM-dependent methyltransferase [Candidatus Moranbacteria bacterium]